MKKTITNIILTAGALATAGVVYLASQGSYANLVQRDFQCSPARPPITIKTHQFFEDTDGDGKVDTWTVFEQGCLGSTWYKEKGRRAYEMFQNVKRGCETTGKVGGFDCLDWSE